MKALLICPAARPGVAAMGDAMPLVNLPILGKAVVEWWLEHLVHQGSIEVRLLATDRPEQVRELVGDGSRWGLHVEVIPEHHELTPTEAREKYKPHANQDVIASPEVIITMDHLPGLPSLNLFESPASWFVAVAAWTRYAATPDRIGLHERQPGVWVGWRAHIAPDAQLVAPCWIGDQAYIGPGAMVGPAAVLENRAYVEADAEVAHSVIGPDTYVGQGIEIKNSLAFGSLLLNWKTNSSLIVPDAILLCALSRPRREHEPVHLTGRILAFLILVLTSPLVPLAALKSKLTGKPVWRTHMAVRPGGCAAHADANPLAYHELAGFSSRLNRWPQLWNVVRGEFAWVGNRPLSPALAARLSNEFERLWLAAPIGLISLADAAACEESFGEEAKLHASYYSAQANWRLDMAILIRAVAIRGLGLTFLASGLSSQRYKAP